jgi:preprotein translocase subunit SecF
MNQNTIEIMKYKWIYLIFSAVILIPGTISLFVYGLNASIDFTGGSVFRYELTSAPSTDSVKEVFEKSNVTVESISVEGPGKYVVRTKSVPAQKEPELKSGLVEIDNSARLLSFETVGPSVGAETTKKAFVALAWAMVGILLYIAYAFRNIPKPYSSFRFGISAIIAMLHDAVIVLGIFSLFGHFLNMEIDSLFITAVLTVLGFSVHDTIVVFDRIRENLGKLPKSFVFEEIVNYSVVETLSRSLATSLTVIITLTSLYLLGGQSIKVFVLAMLIGIVSGTYSSIFNASPILLIWEDWAAKKSKK